MKRYFSDVLESSDPVKLSRYCCYYIILHFALRGIEVQTKLEKSDLVFNSDGAVTAEFIALGTDFMSKSCTGGVQAREFD